MRLIGRADELHTIEQHLPDLKARRAHLLAISGEPGIGKTRLIDEVCGVAERAGHLVLTARATEFERNTPFALLIDALDDYIGSLNRRVLEPLAGERLSELARAFPSFADLSAERGGLEAERYRFHRAVRALLELLAIRKPLLLALDDVHWADPGSLELLLYLSGRLPKAPVLIALAYRPMQVSPQLASALTAAAREGTATSIELGPLTRQETADLLRLDVDADRLEAVFDLSGGNPFFAEQLARAPASKMDGRGSTRTYAGVPRPVIEAIDQELATLDEPERLLLTGAAVTGDPFEPELAAVAAGVDEGEALRLLDVLLQHDLVRPSDLPTQFRFRHPIMRRAVYESARAGWRLAAHRRIIGSLRDRGATASDLADHVEAAAQPGDRDAIRELAEAGHAAAGRAPAVAARLFGAALRLLEADDPSRLELLAPLAMSLGAAGQLEAGRAAVEETLSLLPPQLATVRARLVGVCASIEHLLGRHDQAHERLIREEKAIPEGPSPEAAALQAELCIDAQWISDWNTMADWAERTLATAKAIGSRVLITTGEILVCFAYWILGRQDAERHTEAARGLFDSLTDAELAERLDAALWLGITENLSQRYERSEGHLERGIKVSRATGQGQFLIEMNGLRAWTLAPLGRLREATVSVEEALDAARLAANPQSMCWALTCRCSIQQATGDVDAALRSGEEAVALAGGLDQNIIYPLSHAHLAMVCVETGDYERCITEFERAGAPDFPTIGVVLKVFWWETLARALIGLGRTEEAERYIDVAERTVKDHDLPVSAASAMRARARLLLATGHAAEAGRLAVSAAEAQESRGVRFEAARSRVLAGQSFAAAGERELALAELERAHSELDVLGAHRWRDEAAHELRRLGIRVARTGSRGEGEGVASLSGRELEIAKLAAAGRTNKEIAAALFVSEKTVEKHLARVFEKLGLARRRSIGSRLAEEDRHGSV